MHHCGFIVDFPSSSIPAGCVKEQDARAKTLGLLIEHLVSEHAGSFCWWSFHYPGRLAPGMDPSEAPRVLANLQKDCLALWSAKDHPSAILQKWATRSPLNRPFMQWVIAFAKAGSFDCVLPQLQNMLLAAFRS